MRELLIISSIIILGALLGASYWFPSSELFLYASNDAIMNALRVGTIVALAGILLTTPPRSVAFRAFLMGMSGAVVLVSLALLYSYQLQFIDAFAAVIISIVLAIEGLEYEEAPAPEETASHRHSKIARATRANRQSA